MGVAGAAGFAGLYSRIYSEEPLWGLIVVGLIWPILLAGYILLLPMAFAFYAASQFDKISVPRWLRLASLAGFVGVIIMTAVYMYLFCNAPNAAMISGMQGRYLLPAAPLLILVFLAGKKTLTAKQYSTFATRILYCAVLLLAVMAWVAAVRYYVA